MERPQNNNKGALWMLAVLIAVAAIVYLALPKGSPGQGSVSGIVNSTSTPPAQPTVIVTTAPRDTASWKTYSDDKISFKYPATLPTIYIRGFDWPPKVQLISDPFTCLQAGTTTAPAGKTEAISVNGHLYCVTTEGDAAAGSLYNMYAYAAEKDGYVAIFTFTTQLPQCLNYDDPKKTECQVERDAFDINSIIDPVIQSLKIK